MLIFALSGLASSAFANHLEPIYPSLNVNYYITNPVDKTVWNSNKQAYEVTWLSNSTNCVSIELLKANGNVLDATVIGTLIPEVKASDKHVTVYIDPAMVSATDCDYFLRMGTSQEDKRTEWSYSHQFAIMTGYDIGSDPTKLTQPACKVMFGCDTTTPTGGDGSAGTGGDGTSTSTSTPTSAGTTPVANVKGYGVDANSNLVSGAGALKVGIAGVLAVAAGVLAFF